MNSIQCNIFHHQVAGTLSLDIWDQMMVHCHQHDCSIEFRPLLAVLLLLHNIEIDFLDKDHHHSIFALVGIKNRAIFQINSHPTSWQFFDKEVKYRLLRHKNKNKTKILNPRLFLVPNFWKIWIPATKLFSLGINLISTAGISSRFFIKRAIATNRILDIEKIINIIPVTRIRVLWKLVPKFHYWSLGIFVILLFCKWRSDDLRYWWLQTVFK